MALFDLKAHLKALSEVHAPSGHEAAARAVVRSAWEGLVDEFQQDGLGSLIGIKRATQPMKTARKIMLAAHMDEIGLIVREIVDGFLYVRGVAGMDNRTLLGKPVLAHGRRMLPGVVAAKPPHLLAESERKRYPGFDDLVVDLGLPAEEVEKLVRLGDLITPDAKFMELEGKLVAGKAFDDRACVAAVTGALHELQGMQHAWDVYAVATVQEESGLFGALTAANMVQPDAAIALDVTFAEQPGVPHDSASEMGGGPAIALGANIHPRLYKRLLDSAKRGEIKHQTEAIVANTGTDAWAIQVAREGIPTALLSIPLRNMHSPVETLDLRDVERTARLLARFIAGLDEATLDALTLDAPEENDEAKAAQAV